MSSSPFMSLSRTAAHEASLDGVIVTPYFLSMPSTDAITTEAQSVSGMKPIFTSVFSGASVPAAQAPARTSGSTSDSRLAPATARAVPLNHLRRPASAGQVRAGGGSGGGATCQWRHAWLLAKKKRPARHGTVSIGAAERRCSLPRSAARCVGRPSLAPWFHLSNHCANPLVFRRHSPGPRASTGFTPTSRTLPLRFRKPHANQVGACPDAAVHHACAANALRLCPGAEPRTPWRWHGTCMIESIWGISC